MCENRPTVKELAAAVSEKYGISNERALSDCRSFVEDMLSCGLLSYLDD